MSGSERSGHESGQQRLFPGRLWTAGACVRPPDYPIWEPPYEPGFGGACARDYLLRLGIFGPHADNFHLCRSSQFGLRYLYTGRLEDGALYRQTLLAEVRTGETRWLDERSVADAYFEAQAGYRRADVPTCP